MVRIGWELVGVEVYGVSSFDRDMIALVLSKYAMIEVLGPYLHWQGMALGRIFVIASYIIN
jgi:hypothetical protein